MTVHPPSDPAAEAESALQEAGQTAYEARFAGMILGPRGVSPAWSDLSADARVIWAGVETACLAPLLADIAALRTRVAKAERERMPHMCRDDHPVIRHADSGDDEHCPVCRERDRADAAEARSTTLAADLAEARAEVARLRAVLVEAQDLIGGYEDETGPWVEDAFGRQTMRKIARALKPEGASDHD